VCIGPVHESEHQFQPELLFTLRQVAHEELIAKAGDGLSAPTAMAGAKVLA